MEDVIFSGTSNKPSKNIAEVLITLTNQDKDGPHQYKNLDHIEIRRKIEKNKGSKFYYIKDDKELSKYYNDNLTIDTYVQDKDNEVKLVEVRNAQAITIPIDNVELKNGEQSHTIDKALKVGEIQVYFKGIKKQVAEFVPTPKNK